MAHRLVSSLQQYFDFSSKPKLERDRLLPLKETEMQVTDLHFSLVLYASSYIIGVGSGTTRPGAALCLTKFLL